MVCALKIQVDFTTGYRVGGINPLDPGLVTDPSWQNIDSGFEIRLVLDGRDIEQYRSVPGIEIIEGETAIDEAVGAIYEERYTILNEQLLSESIRQKNIDISDLPNDMPSEALAEELYRRGCLGIRKSPPPVKCGELLARWSKRMA